MRLTLRCAGTGFFFTTLCTLSAVYWLMLGQVVLLFGGAYETEDVVMAALGAPISPPLPPAPPDCPPSPCPPPPLLPVFGGDGLGRRLQEGELELVDAEGQVDDVYTEVQTLSYYSLYVVQLGWTLIVPLFLELWLEGHLFGAIKHVLKSMLALNPVLRPLPRCRCRCKRMKNARLSSNQVLEYVLD